MSTIPSWLSQLQMSNQVIGQLGLTMLQEVSQGHVIRKACGMGDIVHIQERYNLL